MHSEQRVVWRVVLRSVWRNVEKWKAGESGRLQRAPSIEVSTCSLLRLEKGCRVKVVDLKARPDLNGRRSLGP